jgi:transcriptional regulator with XRE-family HTH domain
MGEMSPVSRRLQETREHYYGSRGRSALARDLGIAASTYAHYENDRVPPADVLLRVARLTRVRLEWLINGEGRPEDIAQAPQRDQFLLQRLASLLERRPALHDSLSGMLDALEEAAASDPQLPPRPFALAETPTAACIPVIGSTAAGTARFWSELASPHGVPEADARLTTFVQQASGRSLETIGGDWIAPEGESAPMLVQYSQPDETGLLEFIAAPAMKQRHPTAVAWRIDGDSMAPRYNDGDLVIASPDLPAIEGQPCIARQTGQIGVNCKLFQRDGDQILLIPINENYPVQRAAPESVEWTQRVVGVLRLKKRPS